MALLAGRPAEAIHLLSQALRIQPASASAAMRLGIAQVANGDLAAAEAVLGAVTRNEPKLADGWRYLGLVHEKQNRLDESASARENAVKLAPRFAQAWIDLGSTLLLLRRQSDALRCFARARSLEPANLRARLGCAMAYDRCHRVAEAIKELDLVLRQTPADLVARSFRLSAVHNLPGLTREQVFQDHTAFGKHVGSPEKQDWLNSPDPARRLRIGFFSPDLREHSVAYFLEPLLRHLDGREFEIFLYHDHAIVDAVSQRLQALAAQWRNFVGQTDVAVEAAVRSDAPDLLIDLAGHTAGNRLPLLARRLAPVQISYLGYPNTTGVRAIHYRFVDECTDPTPDADRFATEKLVRFAPTAWTYLPPAAAPAVAALPCGTDGMPLTFGCFNNLGKVSDEVLRCWARILGRVSDARLLIKTPGMSESAVADPLRRRLQEAGIPLARVELLPHTPNTASHLACYSRVDIALDTFPYNGTTTTCEALWMGAPVITIAGDRHAARVGVSLLGALGRTEWITATADEYVAAAVGLARDRTALAEIRSNLRAEMSRSVLLDHARQAERFGGALRQCWRDWCVTPA